MQLFQLTLLEKVSIPRNKYGSFAFKLITLSTWQQPSDDGFLHNYFQTKIRAEDSLRCRSAKLCWKERER